MLADHAYVRLFGIGILEAVRQPVGHGVAEHQHVALWHGLALLLRRRRLGKILHYRPGRLTPRRLLPRYLLLERREYLATEPTTTAAAKSPVAWLLPLRRSAEIEKLRGGRAGDPDQQRDRGGQRDQRADFGEYAEKGLRFRHAARRYGS